MSSLVRKLQAALLFFKLSERFLDAGSVDNFIAEQENQATLQAFLETKNKITDVEGIPATKLNEYLCEFSLHRLISIVITV